jgi:hypothetical protein
MSLNIYIYWNITKRAVDQGVITYKSNILGPQTWEVDRDRLQQIMDETKKDFGFVEEEFQ